MNEAKSERLFWYRVKLLALVAVFLAPFVGGWLAFYVFELRPDSGNYGALVVPVEKIDWPLLQSRDGRRFDGGFGRKWTMLLFVERACDEHCRSNLFYMRQIRTLLGRDMSRLQNVLISRRPVDAALEAYLQNYPDLVVVDNDSALDLYRQFALDGEPEVGSAPKLYLVDPERNFMMHFPSDPDQDRVLEDLKKLLKVSQIG